MVTETSSTILTRNDKNRYPDLKPIFKIKTFVFLSLSMIIAIEFW